MRAYPGVHGECEKQYEIALAHTMTMGRQRYFEEYFGKLYCEGAQLRMAIGSYLPLTTTLFWQAPQLERCSLCGAVTFSTRACFDELVYARFDHLLSELYTVETTYETCMSFFAKDAGKPHPECLCV